MDTDYPESPSLGEVVSLSSVPNPVDVVQRIESWVPNPVDRESSPLAASLENLG